MEKKNMCFLCLVILELSTIHFVESLQISHNSSKIGLPSVIQCTSDNGNDMDWIVDGTTIATCLGATANSCLPSCTECSSVIASPATTFSYTISSVGYTNCIKYGCKERNTVFLSEFTLEVTEFSSDNTSLSPLEPTAGESGAVNITTDCLFPASDESLTINWYKTYQDGKADEALGASFEIYNETQRSTCTDTCGNDTDAKMVIGCRYIPPSNPGTGFQIKVEVMHKAYTDTLNWTFNGTYYDEGQPTTTTTTSSTTTTATTTTTPSTTTSSTTTTSPSTTTTSPSTTTTSPSTTTTSPSTTTTAPSSTTTSPSITATAPSTTSTDAITTTLIAETTESDTNTSAVSNEKTVIIVVASTVGGVVLVGLVVFLGLFLYRARIHGHGKHKHNHKRNTRQQQSGGAYIYSDQNNGHSMAMHPSMASYMDTRHGYPHSIKDYPDRRLRVDHQKQANGRHEGSQMRNTGNVKSRYSVYPGNIVPSRNTQNFYPHHYPRHEAWQRPATTGNIHPGHVNLALHSGYTYYQPQDYSDNWNMY